VTRRQTDVSENRVTHGDTESPRTFRSDPAIDNLSDCVTRPGDSEAGRPSHGSRVLHVNEQTSVSLGCTVPRNVSRQKFSARIEICSRHLLGDAADDRKLSRLATPSHSLTDETADYVGPAHQFAVGVLELGPRRDARLFQCWPGAPGFVFCSLAHVLPSRRLPPERIVQDETLTTPLINGT
jgi:hypothetical protein